MIWCFGRIERGCRRKPFRTGMRMTLSYTDCLSVPRFVLDQIRTVGKTRLVKKLGQIALSEQKAVLDTQAEMFAE